MEASKSGTEDLPVHTAGTLAQRDRGMLDHQLKIERPRRGRAPLDGEHYLSAMARADSDFEALSQAG